MMSWKGSEADIWSAERLRTATDAASLGLWSWNVDTDEVAMDERSRHLWGLPPGPLNLDALSARIHPPDRDLVKRLFDETRREPGPYEIDFRIERDGEIYWINARGLGADRGIVGRLMFGIFLDVTERRRADEAREMLAGEMSHRVKNLFAIATSLIAIAARSATTTAEMADDLTQRLATLGRAHDLIRHAVSRPGSTSAFLGDLFSAFLEPYDEEGIYQRRVSISLPQVSVGEAATTTLALIVHELATNSAKYGALSTQNGTLNVSCSDSDGDVVMVWTERGGPPIISPGQRTGFGSRLISRSISGQFGGSVSYDWLPEGVVITLRVKKSRLVT